MMIKMPGTAKRALLIGAAILPLLLFPSCRDFFGTVDLKEEIEAEVAVASAEEGTVDIRPENENMGFTTPLGSTTVKESLSFNLTATAYSEYAFLSWIQDGGNAGDISFGDSAQRETTAIINNLAPGLGILAVFTSRPYVVSTSPYNNEQDVVITRPIVITFSKAVDPDTVNFENVLVERRLNGSTSSPVSINHFFINPPTVSVSGTGVTLELIDGQTLGTVFGKYEVFLTIFKNVKDIDGNSMATNNPPVRFVTTTEGDGNPPSIGDITVKREAGGSAISSPPYATNLESIVLDFEATDNASDTLYAVISDNAGSTLYDEVHVRDLVVPLYAIGSDASTLVEGSRNLDITISDPSNNSTSQTLNQILYDIGVPAASNIQISPQSPGPGGSAYTRTTEVDVAIDGLDQLLSTGGSGSGISAYILVVSQTEPATPATNDAGWIEGGIGTKQFSLSGSDGGKTVYLFFKDKAGNVSQEKNVFDSIILDTYGPIISNSVLTGSALSETSVSLSWVQASDAICAAADLDYKIYYSDGLTDISTLVNAESNGTVAKDWTRAIALATVSGLNAGSDYNFNVVVRDLAGNKAIYSQRSVTTPDNTAPVPGNSGTITIPHVTAKTVDLSWTKATDTVSAQAALQYKVVYSTSDNISTVADADNHGTIGEDWTADINFATVDNLTNGTTYYFNVLVRDEAGNRAIYSRVTETPIDTVAPVPGGGMTIILSNETVDSVDVAWTKAADDVSAQADLQYKVVYSASNNISTVTDAESNGSLGKDWTADISSATVSSLADSTTYYFNVLVKDTAGNTAVYTTDSTATLDGTPPVPGGGGTLTFSNEAVDSVDVGWTKATDTVSVQTALQYKVVYSTSNNISTVADAESNGSLGKDWTADISSATVSVPDDGTIYHFNVLVKDTAGNTAVYTTDSTATLDGTAPVPGGSGTLTFSNELIDSVDVGWTKATDTASAQAALQYKVVYSTSDNISTVTDAESNGSLGKDWTANISSATVSSLTDTTTYYFNVLVKDTAGNTAVYNASSTSTLTP